MTVGRRFERQRLSPFLEADPFDKFFTGLKGASSAGDKIETGTQSTIRFDPSDSPLAWVDLDFSQVKWDQIPTLCKQAGLEPGDVEFVVLCQSRTLRRSAVVKRVSLKDSSVLQKMKPIRVTDGATFADRWQFEIDIAILLTTERDMAAGHAWRPGSILEMAVLEWERIGESGAIDPKPLDDVERTRLLLPPQAVTYVTRSGIHPCELGNPIEDIYVDSRLLALSRENPDDANVALMLGILLQGAVAQVLVEGQLIHDSGKCQCSTGQDPHPFSLLAQTLKRGSKGSGFSPTLLIQENALGWPPIAESLGRAKTQIHEWIKGQSLSDSAGEGE